MANDKDVRQLPARAAILASPTPSAEVPEAPANDLLHQVTVERDQARATAEALSVRVREVESDGEARKSLAMALTRSFQETRQEKERLAVRLEAAEEEVGRLRAYRNDLEASRLAADRERVRNEAGLAASHRARAEAERLVGDLRNDVQLLHKQIAALGKERDEALLHRADAVKAALASIRNTILEEL